MDLDAVGAHILLMCAAGASDEGYRLAFDKHAIRNILRGPSDENFERILQQLLRGAWKISQCNRWITQSGQQRTLLKQREFSKKQRKNALSKRDQPNDSQIDAKPPSSSTSTTSSTSTINPSITKVIEGAEPTPKKSKKVKSWPPPGTEVLPGVYLTDDQKLALKKDFSTKEIQYWLSEMAEAAEQRPDWWRKTYSNHSLVVRKWRKIKIECGYQWSETKAHYERPSPFFKQQVVAGRPVPTTAPKMPDEPDRTPEQKAADRALLEKTFPGLLTKMDMNRKLTEKG